MSNEYRAYSNEQLLSMHKIASEQFSLAEKRHHYEQTRLEKILAVMMERDLIEY